MLRAVPGLKEHLRSEFIPPCEVEFRFESGPAAQLTPLALRSPDPK